MRKGVKYRCLGLESLANAKPFHYVHLDWHGLYKSQNTPKLSTPHKENKYCNPNLEHSILPFKEYMSSIGVGKGFLKGYLWAQSWTIGLQAT